MAYREYLSFIPNALNIPCPPDMNCNDLNICGGVGHQDCIHGSRTKFGDLFKQKQIWTVATCKQDTDGDGLTNGDEMGDPCCTWTVGTQPMRNTSLSHPAFASSHTNIQSCLLHDVPIQPTGFTIVDVDSTHISVTWDTPKISDTCICYYTLNITTSTSTYSITPITSTSYTICINGSDTYTITLIAYNLKGSSTAVTKTVQATGDGDGISCSPLPQSLTVAGADHSKDYLFPSSGYAVGFFIFILFPLSLLILTHYCSYKPGSMLYQLFVTRVIYIPSHITYDVFQFIYDLNVQSMICIILFIIACITFGTWQYQHYSEDVMFPYGGKAALYRAVGQVLFIPFALIFLPVTKHSIWTRLLGISYDTAIKWHRLLGRIIYILLCIHGIGMYYMYIYDSVYDGYYMWDIDGEQYSNLAGMLCWIFFTIQILFTWEPLRRSNYRLFSYTHLLFLPGIIFAIIHQPDQMIPWVILGLVLFVIDFIIFVWDGWTRPTTCRKMTYLTYDSLFDGYIHLTLSKPSFTFHATQYVYLFIPSISYVPHPFSIVTAAQEMKKDDETIFHLCIKRMGNSTFTDQLAYIAISSTTTSSPSAPSRRIRTHHMRVPTSEIEMSPITHDDVENEHIHVHNIPKIYVMGAFGPKTCIPQYSYIILIAGGIGITPIASLWLTLAQRARATASTRSTHDSTSRTSLPSASHDADTDDTHISMIWAFRHMSIASHLLPTFQHAVETSNHHTHFTILPYCTATSSSQQIDEWNITSPSVDLEPSPINEQYLHDTHIIAADDALDITTECVDQHGNPDPYAQQDANIDQHAQHIANDDDDMEHQHVMDMTSSRTLDELDMMMEAEEKATQQHQHKHRKQPSQIPSQRPHIALGRPDFISLFTSIQSGEHSVSDDVHASLPLITHGRVGIYVCGPMSMVTAVRSAAHQASQTSIEFDVYTESFEL